MKTLSLVLILMISLTIFGKEVGGANMPDSATVGGTKLILNGAGLRTKFFVKVYAGGLYLKSKSTAAESIIAADEPMAIKLQFLREVPREKITEAWSEGFKKSAGSKFGAMKAEIDRFNGCFASDLKKGDSYEISYEPGKGISVKVNGSSKGSFGNLDFKKAVFGIWLGKSPADSDLKEEMLK